MENVEVMTFRFEVTNRDVSYLEGQILTQVDASIADATQRQALKDLFRRMIWDWVYEVNPAKPDSKGVRSEAAK